MLQELALGWVIALLVAAMYGAYEGGIRIHPKLRKRADASKRDSGDESHSLSGVFGLLALLMAFAFSLSLGRFEERRELVTAEANAIGTFATRLSLLPQNDRQTLTPLLRDYAIARVAMGSATAQREQDRRFTEAEALHDRLGEALYAALGSLPPDTRTSLLAQAFDELGDVAVERRAARSAQLPGAVLALLVLYCVVGALLLGYTVAASGAKHRSAALLFFVLLALAFATVLDLDRPRGGIILVPQDEMEFVLTRLRS